MEEIHLRDQQLEKQMEDMKDLLDRLNESKRRDLDMDTLQDKMAQFQNGLDSFLMEMKGLQPDVKKNYKRKLKNHKSNLETLRSDFEWKKENQDRSELLGDAPHDKGPDYNTEKGLMQHGLNVLDESGNRLKKILVTVEQTKAIGVDTAIKVQEQTDQISSMYDDLYEIEDTLERSTAIIKRMFRKVKTEKYIWVFLFLIIAAVIFILVYKAVIKPDDERFNGAPDV